MIITGIKPGFGRNLRRIRQEKQLTQKALSSAIGVSIYSIRGWEHGTLIPTLDEDILSRLCRTLDTSAEALFADPCSQ